MPTTRKPKPHSIGVPEEKWQKVLKLYEDEREVWELLMIDSPSKLYNMMAGFGEDIALEFVKLVKQWRASPETP